MQNNIAEEAASIVYGDREQTYDDPNRNFDKLGYMWTGHLLNKLKPGERITPQDVALMQVMLKISREGFRPKRDNRVDMIGYTLCLDRIESSSDSQEDSSHDRPGNSGHTDGTGLCGESP
jgi:hypothetical protein